MRNGMLSLLLVSLMIIGLTRVAVAQSANRAIIDEVSATTASIELFDLSPEEAAELQASGFRVTHDMCGGVIVAGEKRRIDSLALAHENRDSELRSSAACFPTVAFGGFRTFSQIKARLDSLTNQYPTKCSQRFSIGTSVLGDTLWVVRLSDNPNTTEASEPGVLYVSLLHAREPTGGAALIKTIEELLSTSLSNPVIDSLIAQSQLYFLVVANPDGYKRNESTHPNGGGSWRKNRKAAPPDTGVDLNRNFGFKWGYNNIGSSNVAADDTYRGTSAFSESESQAIKSFILDTTRNIKVCHSLHSFDNATYNGKFYYPYSYDTVNTGQPRLYQNVGWQLHQNLGYTAQRLATPLQQANGTELDWMASDSSKAKQITFLTETRPSCPTCGFPCPNFSQGYWPNPDSIGVLTQELVAPNIFLAKLAANPSLWDFKQGDLTADNVIDAADVTAFVDYLFVTFVEPVPLARADWTCDYQIDVTDLTACVNYVYSMGGTIPDCK